MKSNITVRLGLAIVGILTIGIGAGAKGPGGMGPGGGMGQHRPPFERAFGAQGGHEHFWNNPKVVERLKLTDDQRKSMDGILLAHRETLVDLHASLEKAELTMEPLMKDDQPNEAKILAQIDKVAQARAELEKANARFLLAIRGKLTPDQWKQLQADREHHGPEGHGGWGHDGQDRGGPGRESWKPGDHQGPGGPGGPGGQYHHRQPPPAQGQPAPGAAPAAGPQSQNDGGASSDGAAAPQAGGQQ
jgi:periplasmic protein CpxP/Spy